MGRPSPAVFYWGQAGMKYEIKARYAAPSKVLMKMFSDKAFYSRKMEALGIPKHDVLECSKKGGEFRIKIEFKLPIQAPAMIRKFVSADTTVLQEEQWNAASKTGSVNVVTHGVPVEMKCLATCVDDASGCTLTHSWNIVAKIPIVGGALEKFICADVQSRADKEQRLIPTLLDQYR
jgi:hypothetical protein